MTGLHGDSEVQAPWRGGHITPAIRSPDGREGETFDPKRYTPFEPGVRTERVLSTFPAIDTAADHIKISQGLENVARVMDRGALIRTFQGPDLDFILHSRHQYHWHTGCIPPQPMAVPHIGAVIAKTLGPKNPPGTARGK